MLHLQTSVSSPPTLLSIQAASLSPVLSSLQADSVVTLDGVECGILSHVVAYMENYKIPSSRPSKFVRPLVSSDLAESGCNPWDCEFVTKLSNEDIQLILQIAEKLQIDSLIELMAACIAKTLRVWKATGKMKMEAGFQ